MRLAICQCSPSEVQPRDRLERMSAAMDSEDADVYVFPEMVLTGYVHGDCRDSVPECIRAVHAEAVRRGCCIVFGAPEYLGKTEYNCAYAVSDEGTAVYRKIHLPGFGAFREDRMYCPGESPTVFDYRGVRFGLSICYDIFFPELLKWNSMHGASVNICISASPVTSRPAFEKVLPARAIENTSYLVFVNNVGQCGDLEFFGSSRVLSPLGDPMVSVEGTGTAVAVLDGDVLTAARTGRPVLKDTVDLNRGRFSR